MTDKARSGQPLRIRAGTFNTMVDAAKAWKSGRAGYGSTAAGYRPPDTDVVLVENDSGGDRDRFDILGVDDVIISPTDNEDEFANRVMLSGTTPNPATHLGRFVVLLEPIADGEIGRASISGVCPCEIDVIDSAHAYADINPDSGDRYTPASRQFGSAEILWKESGTGTKWAVLRLGSPKLFRRFELKTSLAIGGTATAHPLDWTGAAYAADTASDNEFTVYDSLGMYHGWARVAGTRNGARGLAVFHHDREVWEVVDLQHVARSINFTLTEDMGYTTSGQAECSINDYYQGLDPTSVFSVNKVYDPQGIHANAKSGAKGKARFDDRSDEYHIVEMEREDAFLQLTLSGSASISSTSETAITGFSALVNSDTSVFDTSSPASGYDVKITRAGVYEFNYTVQLDNSEDNVHWCQVELWLRDTSNPVAGSGIRELFISQCGGGEYRTVSTSVLVEVDADESYKLVGKLTNSTSDNVNVLGAASPNEARWSIKYVGPPVP